MWKYFVFTRDQRYIVSLTFWGQFYIIYCHACDPSSQVGCVRVLNSAKIEMYDSDCFIWIVLEAWRSQTNHYFSPDCTAYCRGSRPPGRNFYFILSFFSSEWDEQFSCFMVVLVISTSSAWTTHSPLVALVELTEYTAIILAEIIAL